MKIITHLTLCFIAYEFAKIVFLPSYYRVSINRAKKLPLVILEIAYLIYLIGLFFTPYWYVGLCVIGVSFVTAFQLMDDVTERRPYNKEAKRKLMTDSVVSIIILLVIITKEFVI